MRRLLALVVSSGALAGGLAMLMWGVVGWQAAVGPAPSLAAGEWTATSTASPADAVPPTTVDTIGDAAQRLIIPSLSVDAELLPGAIRDRQLVLPSDPSLLTLSSAGADPCTGDSGTVLVSGHVASHGVRGALWPLSTTRPGAVATITCPGSQPSVWRAVKAWESEKSSLDQTVFDAGGERRLVVITCGGPVMSNGHYRDNVLVEFEPVN